MFSGISQGAKNLFNSAKTITKKYSPIKGKQGTVQVSDMGYGFGETTSMTSAQASKALELGQISSEQLSQQTLGSNKWFVQGSQQTDKIITDTINEAYKSTYNSFSPNAQTYFNDLKRRATDIKTYVNDAEIGSAIENSIGAAKSYADDFATTPYKIDIDFNKTNDYVEMPNGGYRFTGDSTFKNINEANAAAQAAKKASTNKLLTKYSKALLTPSDKMAVSYAMPNTSDMTMQTSISGYTGTDIEGAAGGSLLKGAFSEAEQKKIMGYYRNMNLIGSS